MWGEGSGTTSDPFIAAPYIRYARQFIAEHDIGTVIDLGCGDARLGRAITAGLDVPYVGMDIVPDMVRREVGSSERFVLGNMAVDPLPLGDLCLIAHVLQHLDNATVATILGRVRAHYRWVLVTEVQPAPARTKRANIDKPTGPSTRSFLDSGFRANGSARSGIRSRNSIPARPLQRF